MKPRAFHILFIALSLLVELVASEGGFCSAASMESSKHLYWKVSNPTLSPSHLQDLPGFTRSVFRTNHALITPESQVFSPLPHWSNTLGAYLITPAIGSHFAMYLAKMQGYSKSGSVASDVERFVFVVKGTVTLTDVSGVVHKLEVDSYAYIPPKFEHSIVSEESSTLVVFERRHASLANHVPELIVSSTDQQPLLETPGETDCNGGYNTRPWELYLAQNKFGYLEAEIEKLMVFELRKLLPTSMAYDFNVHIMDFQPGEYLNVKEVHYNQHGLLLLEGHGIYRLDESWYPVQAGDAIWMAPFVPQWYAALGNTRSRYLLYKDVNRDPL